MTAVLVETVRRFHFEMTAMFSVEILLHETLPQIQIPINLDVRKNAYSMQIDCNILLNSSFRPCGLGKRTRLPSAIGMTKH